MMLVDLVDLYITKSVVVHCLYRLSHHLLMVILPPERSLSCQRK